MTEVITGEAASLGAADFFTGAGRAELLAAVRGACLEGVAVVVLTGSAGAGKSVLCHRLAVEMPERWHTLLFPETVESFESVVRAIAAELTLGEVDVSRKGMSETIQAIGDRLKMSGNGLVLIFDSADKIYLATLERVRKMLDQLAMSEVSMQIVLSGRPLLLDNLKQLAICDFQQASERRFSLAPLSEAETESYLDHATQAFPLEERKRFMLEVAGRVFTATGGNLRKIDELIALFRDAKGHGDALGGLLATIEEPARERPAVRRRRRAKPSLPKLWPIQKKPVLIVCSLLLLGGVFFFLGGEESQDQVDQAQPEVPVTESAPPSVAEEGLAIPPLESRPSQEIDEPAPPVAEPIAAAPEQPEPEQSEPVSVVAERSAGAGPSAESRPAAEEVIESELLAESPDKESPATGTDEEEAEVVVPAEAEAQGAVSSVEEDLAQPEVIGQPPTVQGESESLPESRTPESEQAYDATPTPLPEKQEEVEGPTSPASPPEQVAGVGTEPANEEIPESVVVPDAVDEKAEVTDAMQTAMAGAEEEVAEPVMLIVPAKTKRVLLSDQEIAAAEAAASNIFISGLAESPAREPEVPVIRSESERNKILVPEKEAEPSAPEPVTVEQPAAEQPVVSPAEVVEARGAGGAKIAIPLVARAVIPGEAQVIDDLYRRRLNAGRSWLTGNREGAYTIQLMVLSSNDSATSIRKILAQPDYRRIADTLYLLPKGSNQSQLFVFYGQYDSMTAARKARNSLPSFLANHRPYVLSIPSATAKVR